MADEIPEAALEQPSRIGRPTKYDPAFCEAVIRWGRDGKSIEWMCAEIGVVYNTLKGAWPAAHPEFAEALELAEMHAMRWWEEKGQTGIADRNFNANLYSRSMAARFPKKWRESRHIEATGADGAPLNEVADLDLADVPPEVLRAIAALKVKPKGEPEAPASA